MLSLADCQPSERLGSLLDLLSLLLGRWASPTPTGFDRLVERCTEFVGPLHEVLPLGSVLEVPDPTWKPSQVAEALVETSERIAHPSTQMLEITSRFGAALPPVGCGLHVPIHIGAMLDRRGSDHLVDRLAETRQVRHQRLSLCLSALSSARRQRVDHQRCQRGERGDRSSDKCGGPRTQRIRSKFFLRSPSERGHTLGAADPCPPARRWHRGRRLGEPARFGGSALGSDCQAACGAVRLSCSETRPRASKPRVGMSPCSPMSARTSLTLVAISPAA